MCARSECGARPAGLPARSQAAGLGGAECGPRTLGLHAAAEALASGLLDPVFLNLGSSFDSPSPSSWGPGAATVGILRRHAFSARTGGPGLFFYPVLSFSQAPPGHGVPGRVTAAPPGRERKGRCGKAEYGRGAGATRALGPPWPRRGKRNPRRLCCLGERPLVTVPGCHFVAWPPFRAAEGSRAAGEGWGRGGGRARAPLLPPRAPRRRARPLCSPPPAAPRPPRGRALVEPRDGRRERRARSPRPRRPLSPPQAGPCPPHPGCVKGIHFVGEGSELHRGKLECHPEKDGALGSPALGEAARPLCVLRLEP